MGLYQSIHLGPYFQCTTVLEEYIETTPHCSHKPKPEFKHCPECGKPNGTVTNTHLRPKKSPNWEHIDNLLSSQTNYLGKNAKVGDEHIEVFTPNSGSRKPPRDFSLNSDCRHTVDIENIHRIDEIQWLGQAYADMKMILERDYGYENVEIKWGLVIDWS